MNKLGLVSVCITLILCLLVGLAIWTLPYSTPTPTIEPDYLTYESSASSAPDESSHYTEYSTVEHHQTTEYSTLETPQTASSASSGSNHGSEETVSATVHVSVIGPDGAVCSGKVSFSDGDSAYDVTRKLLDKKNIEYKATGMGSFVYISEIAGYKERDYGPMSGWLYTVNSEQPNIGCGGYSVKKDDRIEWAYSKDE